MKTDTQSSSSLLTEAARHERELLGSLDAAREEAKRIVDTARDDARSHLQESNRVLNDEIAQSRREAESARQAEFDRTIADAESKLAGARDAAAQRVDQMTQDVLRLFVPSAGDR